jgi:uncharacterized protein (TIGR02687 family)
MDVKQLSEGINQAFVKENHRIVFWYDPQGDFRDDLTELEVGDVQIVNMQGESALGVKMRLELDDTANKFLLYFPSEEPEIEKDWLLDIKSYSRCFYADRLSIIFNELGLQQQSLRAHMANRERFFGNKSRVSALKNWVTPATDEAGLDLAMIATLVKADSADLPHILFALAEELVADDLGLEDNPASLEELLKFNLVPALLRELTIGAGYPASQAELNGEAEFKFGHFLIRLIVTGFCEGLVNMPPWAKDLVLPSASARSMSRALLSRWRDSSRYYKAFDAISGWVAAALQMDQKLDQLAFAQLTQGDLFEAAERKIIVELAQTIPTADRKTLSSLEAVIALRLDGYWASRHKDDPVRSRYRTIYAALQAAIKLFNLRLQHDAGFHYPTLTAFYKAYEDTLYQLDTAYRHYFAASRDAHVDILKALDAAVEHCYGNWYIDNLAKSWGEKLESEHRLANWRLPEVENQQDFFANQVLPILEKPGVKRLVVIVSDAFRYEAAVELRDRINEKRYSEATLSSQLGVVPSYTTLGMASLLPHKTLEYRDSAGDDVFVDGLSSKGTIARQKILVAHNGMAVTADVVKGWSREDGREALKDKRLVYVYHNVVDARGDSASTESGTLEAVEDAIEELTELTRKIMIHFNTSTVLVTADHGFLFQHSAPDDATRTSLAEKPANTLKFKKRYLIGHDLPLGQDVWTGSTQQTAGTLSDTGFWIPKGANRFHFVGGARFVHGGAMPQEIVVPVLTVKQLRGAKAEKRTRRKVGVISSKSTLKMVNNMQKFDLLQTEPVSEQLLPVTVAVAIYDGDQIVSSEEVVSFDVTSDSMAARVKSVRLSLAGNNFDRKKEYHLIIKDKDLMTEIERYRITIDLAFTDDFL